MLLSYHKSIYNSKFLETMEEVKNKQEMKKITSIKKAFILLAVLLLLVMTGCKKSEMGDKYRGCFENEKAVNLSDLIRIHNKYQEITKDSSDCSLFSAFYGQEMAREIERYDIVDNTSFAIKLPQYDDSEHPFLANAEVFYNSCLLAFNVWSNHELWLRGCDGFELAETKDVIYGIKYINAGCIRDKELRDAASIYKDSIILMMGRPTDEWGEEESSMDLMIAFGNKIEAKAYRYFSDEEKFVDSLTAMTNELLDSTKPVLEKYKKTEGDKRLKMMLHTLNYCATFDGQCSLLLNWANCPESEGEDEWILAVADRLMRSGKYNPCLNNIWITWRCLFQYSYCGISRDSCIPNNIYNDMRKRCYLACLKRIEKHPDDIFAMNCAAAIGGRVNLNRFGENLFGNEAVVELHSCLSGRYESDDEDEEEF